MTAPRDSIWQRALQSLGARRGAPPLPDGDTAGSRFGLDVPAPVAGVLAPGALFGGYRIERILARGAAGLLYAAVDPRNGAPVALKTLPLAGDYEGADLDDARRRFLQEAKAAASLHHPDIVAVHGAGEAQGHAFIVMELLGGCDLTRYTRPARLLPEPVVLRVAARVAEALAHAHAQGVVHRDIKPANVMVDLPQHQVKVTDFGIARVSDGSRSRSGVMLGTPAFMAPEQLAGRAVDGRADLYALGVLLFQLLTGQLPYDASSMGQLLVQVARGSPRELRALRPGLPPALGELIGGLLHKEPGLRPADGRAVAAALRRIEDGWPQAAPPVFGCGHAAAATGPANDPGHNPSRS